MDTTTTTPSTPIPPQLNLSPEETAMMESFLQSVGKSAAGQLLSSRNSTIAMLRTENKKLKGELEIVTVSRDGLFGRVNDLEAREVARWEAANRNPSAPIQDL